VDQCRAQAADSGGGLDTDAIAPYVLRALRSDTPLPPDRAGTNRLRQAIKMANQPPRPSKISPHPPAAARVSGRVYNFPANAIDLRSATLSFPKGGAASFDLRRADWVLQGPVGLDGVYRFSNTGPGGQPLGARGRWRSPSTFELDIDMVANINRLIFAFTFDENGSSARVDVSEKSTAFAPFTLTATQRR
jgi:hypothetical protein